MFSSAEFIEEWNQIFSFKIKESDLAKPTEAFVFNALINYLQRFNFDTAPMIQLKNSENLSERRSFLVRFCNYIDHIYKISDKSHCFLYYDLQHPAPKKTVHMLNHLLNYLFYYNMYRESVESVAFSMIRSREEIVDKINTHKVEIEQIELKSKMIEKKIKDYRMMVPQTYAELNALSDAEMNASNKIKTLEEKLQELNKTLTDLRKQETYLTKEIVSQEEVDRLLTTRESLSKAIAEQETLESSTYTKNQEHTASLAKLQNIMTSIDKAMDLNPTSTLTAHKEYTQKFKDLENKFNEMTQKKESLVQAHERLLEDLKYSEEELSSKTEFLNEMNAFAVKELEQVKLQTQLSEASVQAYEHDLHVLETKLEEEKDITDYILESTTELIQATMENCFESKAK